MTISQKLIDVNTAKTNIKAAIEAKGVDTTGVPFTNYHTKIAEIPSGGPVEDTTDWVRNPEWLTVPSVENEPETIRILAAVLNDHNNLYAFLCQGDYTIDWGDGTVENYTSNTICQHYYDFDNVALDGTLTTFGYKQVIITITPQAGSTITYWDHNYNFLEYRAVRNYLEMHFNLPSCSGNGNFRIFQPSSYAPLLEHINIHDLGVQTNISNFRFQGFQNLTKITIGNPECTSGLTSLDSFFRETNLFQLPHINTSNVTYLAYAFYSCRNLRRIPDTYDFSNVNNMQSTFMFTPSLTTLPDIFPKVPKVTNMSSTFRDCGIETLPDMDTSLVTDWGWTFYRAMSLKEIPDGWSAAGASGNTFQSLFRETFALKSYPPAFQPAVDRSINASFNWDQCGLAKATINYATNVTSASYQIPNTRLEELEVNYALPSTASHSNAFYQNLRLKKFSGSIDLSGCNNVSSMFYQCQNIISITGITWPNSISAPVTNLFGNCYSLSWVDMTNMNSSFSVNQTNLGADALNFMFTTLPTVTNGQTVQITNTPGRTTCDTSIATAKGWTVIQ